MNSSMGFEPLLEVRCVEDAGNYREFFESTRVGVRFIAEEQYGEPGLSLKADSGDFAKWLRIQQPNIPIDHPKSAPKIVLHGAEIWLPLIQIAADTSMQIFLNMAANYLYDKSRGNLKTDENRIHMSVIYQDKKEGKVKKFEFSGDHQSLAKAIKRFDLDNFFNDNP